MANYRFSPSIFSLINGEHFHFFFFHLLFFFLPQPLAYSPIYEQKYISWLVMVTITSRQCILIFHCSSNLLYQSPVSLIMFANIWICINSHLNNEEYSSGWRSRIGYRATEFRYDHPLCAPQLSLTSTSTITSFDEETTFCKCFPLSFLNYNSRFLFRAFVRPNKRTTRNCVRIILQHRSARSFDEIVDAPEEQDGNASFCGYLHTINVANIKL